MTGENAAPAEMPGVEERFTAAYLGFNPHDPSTWAVDIVNRLVRIRAERGDQAFVQEVANLITPPPGAGIHSLLNACCYREQCKALEARALAAEADSEQWQNLFESTRASMQQDINRLERELASETERADMAVRQMVKQNTRLAALAQIAAPGAVMAANDNRPVFVDRKTSGSDRTALYRHWDEEDNLLYVGVSLSAVARLSDHMANSRWAPDIAKVTVEYYGSRPDALAAEQKAIETEAPAYNVIYNRPHQPAQCCGPDAYPGRVFKRKRQIPDAVADDLVRDAILRDGVVGVQWKDVVSRSHGALFGRRPVYYTTNDDLADALRRVLASGEFVEDAGAYYPARCGNYTHVKAGKVAA